MLAFVLFAAFLRGDGATACHLSFTTPVESIRPRGKSALYILYQMIRYKRQAEGPKEGEKSKLIAINTINLINSICHILLLTARSISLFASRSFIRSRFS